MSLFELCALPPSPTSDPVTPPTMPQSVVPGITLPSPPSSIQNYRDALRRDLRARYEAAARAGVGATAPPDAKEDPDYGYDEDPFDTRARLLLSVATPITPPETSPTCERLAEEAEDVVLDSPAPSRRRWSFVPQLEPAPPSGLASAAMSRSSSFSCCDTPGSEMSFEIGRTADYVGLYGRLPLRVHASGISPARTPPPPPVISSTSPYATFNPSPLGAAPKEKDRRQALLARLTPLKMLSPLTPLAPSPRTVTAGTPADVQPQPQAPPRRCQRPRRPVPDLDWDGVVLSRSESETMLLAAAGFASQRSRGA
ncbi:hypothetical protein CspeluHIS016_0101260 [Cutaneotrichosporon spelunceum]|uniref:Uncharacterized protein n=1 Tax=Cutaneotrichosporon spelunceum TaxID=1672016 RepID=A0AAD3Y7B8_9TREE|nr:hypothetical protein CspeluHIS016_0101260 [Cutaneotrichosporon spelunceum]